VQHLKCQYPNCTRVANATFALVRLCYGHSEMIWDETHKYYSRTSTKPATEARPHYYKIAHLIPWSRKF
jgi:hypothetical protein